MRAREPDVGHLNKIKTGDVSMPPSPVVAQT